MKTTLKQIKLTFFKGIKDLSVSFDEQTSIYGDNGTGKTTLFDAFTWLLFGKDHSDNAKFEIKTLDENNKAIQKIDHEVEGIILIDGEKITLKRIYREKWVKRRGSTEPELSGHETVYFWNEVPLQQKEFQSKITGIIDETIFKLVTNPLYFNEMKWQHRRELLTEIAGAVTDEEISKANSGFQNLLSKLSNKSIDEYKKEVAAKKKKIKTELEQIPTRVDELQKSLPKSQDWGKIESDIENLTAEIAKIDEQLQDKSKVSEAYYKELEEKQAKLHELKKQKSDFELQSGKEISSKLNKKQDVINDVKREKLQVESDIKDNIDKLQKLSDEHTNTEITLTNLREEFANKRDENLKIDESSFCCPTCRRAFDSEDIEAKKAELQENFNANKAKQLEAINEKGKSLKEQLVKLKENIEECHRAEEQLNSVLANVQKDLEKAEKTPAGVESTQAILKDNKEYQDVVSNIEAMEELLAETEAMGVQTGDVATKALKQAKTEHLSSIDQLKDALSARKQIERGESRIKELNTQYKDLAQQLADAENEEFTITSFISAKINKVEEAVNNLFPNVRFKMFEEQLNGGVNEVCETLINGVPFSDANNASKIQAGIEIINVLSKHYNFYAPIFIDNAESVTTLPTTDNQIIRLIVEEGTKQLTIK